VKIRSVPRANLRESAPRRGFVGHPAAGIVIEPD
jgi:hypothetical protein